MSRVNSQQFHELRHAFTVHFVYHLFGFLVSVHSAFPVVHIGNMANTYIAVFLSVCDISCFMGSYEPCPCSKASLPKGVRHSGGHRPTSRYSRFVEWWSGVESESLN